ncbi:MAG: peptide ABC transporter substrate-binding protein [Caldilineaceae bacterium]|nr:peptide ABC transporter substrate-binding protein [Caldilineaceae bacterium]
MKKLTRSTLRVPVVALLLAAMAVLLAACGTPVPTDTAAPAEPQVKELTILYWQAASLPGPFLSGGTKDQDAGAITLEPLASVDPDGVLMPRLAAEIPTIENGGVSEDGLTITWTLQEGLLWSDGTPMTADDAVFTWEYCTHPETGCTTIDTFDGVVSVEAPDDTTVVVTFDKFTPYPYTAFVTAASPIISRAQFGECVGAAAQTCSEQNLSPLGTGAYRLTDFKVNDVATYERNPHYRGEPAYFDRVVFKGGGDAASAARAVLETGEADYAWNLQVEPQILAEMEAKGGGEIIVAFSSLVERLLVNQTNPDEALGDDRSEYLDGTNPHPFLVGTPVAQAMSMAIDRSVIAENLYGFGGRPICNVIPGPKHYVSTANDGCQVQDIEGANALLDEAGIVDTDGDGIREYNGMPLSVRYQTSTNSVRQKTQAVIKQWWTEIGIETELLNHDASVFFGGDPNSPDTYQKFYTDIQMYTTGPDIDPQVHLSQWQCQYIPERANSWAGGNIFRGCNPEYDELFQMMVKTPVGPERERLVKTLNDMNVQSGMQIPLVYRGRVAARTNSLQGVLINGWDTELWNVGDWTREE